MNKSRYFLLTLAIGISMAPTQKAIPPMLRQALDYGVTPESQAAVTTTSRRIGQHLAPRIEITPQLWDVLKLEIESEQTESTSTVTKNHIFDALCFAVNIKLTDFDNRRLGELVDFFLNQPYEGRHIQSLNLTGCTKITDAGLAHLAELPYLQSLNLTSCWKITDDGLAHFTELISLRELIFPGVFILPLNITGASLAHLTKLRNLVSLDLTGCENITNVDLANLAGLTNLRSLNLGDCRNINDAGLAQLQGLTRLQQLYLTYCYNITDNSLAIIAQNHPFLQALNLFSGHNITDDGLAHLKKLEWLQSLGLNHCNQITGAVFANLAHLSALQELFLYNTNITNDGLAHLANLTELQTLNLKACYKITKADVVALQKQLPRVKILHY